MDELRIEAHESMFIIDGGVDAELPGGSGGPVLAGPEAIFIAGRVAADAPTIVRVGRSVDTGELVEAYEGEIATPDHLLRVVTIEGATLGEIRVPDVRTHVQVWLTDLDEPDEILVVVGSP